MAPIDLLDQPVYGLGEVDSLLALRPGTARRWIEGYERRGKAYLPVVRPEPNGSEIVTWGEFVETRFLSEYRNKNVPLLRMRPAIDRLREKFGKYPLAHARPFVAGRDLVLSVQEDLSLESALRLVEVARNGQLLLTDPAQQFWQSVEFDDPSDGVALRIHPHGGNRIVVLDPMRQFGQPVVRSVPTEVLAEQFGAGDSVEAIAETYELGRDEVEAALRYERERMKATAPSAA